MSRVTAWYVSNGIGNSARGPFATDLVRAMLRDGQLNSMDLVFREGESEWRPASLYAELRNVSNSSLSSQHPTEYNSEPVLPDLNDTRASVGEEASQNEADISWIVLRPHSSTYLQEGPFKTDYIRDGLKKGTFQFGQYAWHVGMSQWMRIGDLREFDRRSTPRDSIPHVPPPLPDPITAVLLEDDGDFESEEFHVNLKPSKYDATPTDPAFLYSTRTNGSTKDSVAIGGAAAENPESGSRDLARVPWEERNPGSSAPEHSGVFAQAVELLDDESSFSGFKDSDFDDDLPTQVRAFREPSDSEPEIHAEANSSQPFIPRPAMPPQLDSWEKWGRFVAAAGMGAIAAVFSGHLLTFDTLAKADISRRAAERALVGHVELEKSKIQPVQMDAAVVPNEAAATSTEPPLKVATIQPPGLDIEDAMSGPEGGLADDSRPAPGPGVTSPQSATVTNSLPQTAKSQIVTTSVETAIIGLKLNQPDGQLLFQGAFPVGQPIQVTFKGRLGEVLSKLNVRKSVTLIKSGAEIPSIKLSSIGLPQGAYTVEVTAGSIQAKSDVFIGKRDARFLDRLETHLRDKSLEMQAQKKVLFYAAQELDTLARDLGLNYGQLRGKPEMWTKFYTKWKSKVSAVERSVAELAKRSIEDQAYPDETSRLQDLLASLKDTSVMFEQGVGAQRDVASDSLTDLIAELARQKEAIGNASARAANPSGKASTSKAL